MPVDPGVRSQFGVKRGHQVFALADQHRVALIPCEDLRAVSRAPDDGSPYEDSFQGPVIRPEWDHRYAAIDLTAVGVSLYRQIHESERRLRRIQYFTGNQDGARACSKYRFHFAELAQRLKQLFHRQQFEHRRTLATRYDQTVNAAEIFRGPNLNRLGAGGLQGFAMRGEIALQRQHPNQRLMQWLCAHGPPYQPRVCISSDSGTFEISKPGIASPSSSLASSNFTGSR